MGPQPAKRCLETCAVRNIPFTAVHLCLFHSVRCHSWNSICLVDISFPVNTEPWISYFSSSVSSQISSKHNWVSSISHVRVIKLPPLCLIDGGERCFEGLGPPVHERYQRFGPFWTFREALIGDFVLWWTLISLIYNDFCDISRSLNFSFTSLYWRVKENGYMIYINSPSCAFHIKHECLRYPVDLTLKVWIWSHCCVSLCSHYWVTGCVFRLVPVWGGYNPPRLASKKNSKWKLLH